MSLVLTYRKKQAKITENSQENAHAESLFNEVSGLETNQFGELELVRFLKNLI